MSYLYAGKILWVNLTTGDISVTPTDHYTDLFWGAKGVNTQIVYQKTSPKTAPFSPENVIAVGTGPLTGTSCPGTGRIDITTKSPETGILGSASMGGYFGPELKFAGYDHVVVTGKAEKPVYLAIDNNDVQIKDAAEMWGKDSYLTQELIKKDLQNGQAQTICIGPCGESRVVFSTVQHGLTNAASRTGLGAVMGSKNLKAITAIGTKGLKIAKPKEYLAYSQELSAAIRATPQHAEWSTVGVMKLIDYYYNGDFGPASNFQSYVWDKNWQMTRFCEKFSYQRYGCFNCPVHCMEAYSVDGVGVGAMSCQPYLEITSKIGNHDVGQGVKLMLQCQRLGLENISFISAICWLMELRQRKIITDKDTDGIPMEWGNVDSALKIAEKIVKREGIGDLLADGLVSAAKKLGRGSEYYAIHTKKLPHYGLNQDSFRGQGLGTAIAPRGDYVRTTPDLEVCSGLVGHMGESEEVAAEYREYYDAKIEAITGTRKSSDPLEYEGKAKMVGFAADHNNSCDQTAVCKWLTPFFDMPLTLEVQAKFLSLGLGEEIPAQELLERSQRLEHLVRAYNCREGVRREDDSLPERYFEEEVADGRHKGSKYDRKKFEHMKDEYYDLRGWDKKTAIPTRDTLKKFRLDFVAEEFEKMGLFGKETQQPAAEKPAPKEPAKG